MFTDELFARIGFTKLEDKTYEKVIIAKQYQVTPKAFMQLEKRLKFKIYKVHKSLGTNIEYYVDNKLAESGYWRDEADFLSHQFKF